MRTILVRKYGLSLVVSSLTDIVSCYVSFDGCQYGLSIGSYSCTSYGMRLKIKLGTLLG